MVEVTHGIGYWYLGSWYCSLTNYFMGLLYGVTVHMVQHYGHLHHAPSGRGHTLGYCMPGVYIQLVIKHNGYICSPPPPPSPRQPYLLTGRPGFTSEVNLGQGNPLSSPRRPYLFTGRPGFPSESNLGQGNPSLFLPHRDPTPSPSDTASPLKATWARGSPSLASPPK